MQVGPGTKDYGALSLAVQYYAKPEIVANVPPNCFIPRPNVGSAVIRLTRHETPRVQVKDEAFPSEAMGKGVGIEPENGKVYAPFDGNVDAVFPTGHLVGLSDGNGAEVLIHIGVDTVKLEGKGFKTYVSQGDKVKKGDLLVEFDVELLKKEGYDTTVMFITTDTSKDVQVLLGRKEAVKDIAFLTV